MTTTKTTGQIVGAFGLLTAAIGLGFTVADVAAQEVAPNVMTAGEAVYTKNCAPCHQAKGQGEGAAPPLAGNSRLRDERLVLGQILMGGEYMPAFGFQLSDADIAAVATYVRNSWDNKHGPVAAEQVAAMR
jgi:mono/diheme cytochrome c family protein